MEGEIPTTHLAILHGLRVGMWSAREHQGLWLLILPSKEQFVFVAEKALKSATGGPNDAPRRFGTGTSALLRQLGAHSPFRSTVYKSGGCAFAFEVPFDSVCGIDYSNPLIRPGRLVLEAKNVRKREFVTVRTGPAH